MPGRNCDDYYAYESQAHEWNGELIVPKLDQIRFRLETVRHKIVQQNVVHDSYDPNENDQDKPFPGISCGGQFIDLRVSDSSD